jgi:hypothetical protein
MREMIRRVEYLRQYAALLRAYARRTKGNANSKLIQAAEYLDSQVAVEATRPNRMMQTVNGQTHSAYPSAVSLQRDD